MGGYSLLQWLEIDWIWYVVIGGFMDKELSPIEAIEMLKKGMRLEYLWEDSECHDSRFNGWYPLCKDSPIRLLWECKIRVA
jgi:hypothetical protein